jgi:enoyl-CoA hydratase/carnithine racemase
MHCHYVVSFDDAKLGMPEVTLPVAPVMEGCHWSFRKARKQN